MEIEVDFNLHKTKSIQETLTDFKVFTETLNLSHPVTFSITDGSPYYHLKVKYSNYNMQDEEMLLATLLTPIVVNE